MEIHHDPLCVHKVFHIHQSIAKHSIQHTHTWSSQHLLGRREGRWRAAVVEAGAVPLQEGPEQGEGGLLQTDAVGAAQGGGLSAGQGRGHDIRICLQIIDKWM